MKPKLLALAGAIVVAAAVVAAQLYFSRPKHPHPGEQESAHGNGIDNSMATVRALYHGPEGKTPCETAYNAFKNSMDVAKNDGAKAVVQQLAPREEFLAKCQALPANSQTCMIPIYLATHRDVCANAKPPAEVMNAMVTILQRQEPKRGQPAENDVSEPPPQNLH